MPEQALGGIPLGLGLVVKINVPSFTLSILQCDVCMCTLHDWYVRAWAVYSMHCVHHKMLAACIWPSKWKRVSSVHV